MNSERLTHAELAALGEVFGAEIEGRLPFHSKLKIYADLTDNGYLERGCRVSGGVGVATGFLLTHKGRMAFCGSCG